MKIEIYSVELTNVEEKQTVEKRYYGDHAMANRYAHNKAKACVTTMARVLKIEAEIISENQIAFYMDRSKYSLEKEG